MAQRSEGVRIRRRGGPVVSELVRTSFGSNRLWRSFGDLRGIVAGLVGIRVGVLGVYRSRRLPLADPGR